MDFGRIVTAMVTPFDENLKIDYNRLQKVVDHLLKTGTESIVVTGTTGESPTLSHQEKLDLFKKVVEFANGRAKVIAGTSTNDTAASVEFSKEAEQCGVDGLLLVSPYYNRPSQEGLYRHFRAIAEATPLPNIIYNIPGRTGVHVDLETMLRLAEIPNVVATKESPVDFNQVLKLMANKPEKFTVYSGDDKLLLPFLALGGYGIVSVASHVVGLQIKELIDAFLAGQTERAVGLHNKLMPIFEGLFLQPSPSPVKAALNLIDVPVGGVRLPLVESDEKFIRYLRSILKPFYPNL
ncbi:4-hydroxy-tetrahydrodipicolinate synthase [Effusibacillus dendaii]|uniref:4-hydroxy-tetrahydrodipicolinate synthase n=1 Tax=Effusibacillus dendaii TaxID=2743772 RepID=A0A7I8D5A2_9BACL|nr:4-hydroxy-tetrahydrodipicolinate synthase [Effusibacillus dendaii]BCJ85323.1 4-hydroxy-tetrahydrodipicolinate synthase [Effusibacillus dendaii]